MEHDKPISLSQVDEGNNNYSESIVIIEFINWFIKFADVKGIGWSNRKSFFVYEFTIQHLKNILLAEGILSYMCNVLCLIIYLLYFNIWNNVYIFIY